MKWLLVVSLIASVLLITACGTPPPAPATPQPTPSPPTPQAVPSLPPAPQPETAVTVDTPRFSAEEVCAHIWSRLTQRISEKYDKSCFDQNTRVAKYQGNGKWTFEVSGIVKETTALPARIYMETRTVGGKQVEVWFEEQKQKVTSSDLKLTAVFYEKTMTVDALDVKESNWQESTEVLSTKSLKGELLVEWISATYSGSAYYTEGSVKNVGKMRLLKVKIEIALFGEDGKLVKIITSSLSPETINPSETAHFREDFYLEKKLKSYNYRFVSDTGLEIIAKKEGEQPPPGQPQA